MTNSNSGSMIVDGNNNRCSREKLGALLEAETRSVQNEKTEEDERQSSWSPIKYGDSSRTSSNNASPYSMSPWNYQPAPSSPFNKSPWSYPAINIFTNHHNQLIPQNGLLGSFVRQEGHVYSLAVSGDLLYTGSDSKNIRIWKDLKDFTGFKSSSGLVKTIVISGSKIFTGHQDGKIRVWKVSSKNPTNHKRIGTLPTFKEYVKSSMNPKNYVEVRRRRNAVKVKHFDAISSLSLDHDEGLLYSGSWDKTIKVWRMADSKCLDSISAHDDAVNAVVAVLGGCVLTGSADGTVKVWKRVLDEKGKKIKHLLDRILLKQENAVNALAVNRLATVVYCGSSDGLVNFWDRDQKGGFTRGDVLRGHNLAVLCLAAAGNFVFSGSADKNVCAWKRDDNGLHTCHLVLTGHTGPVKCIAVEEKEPPQEGRCEKGGQWWIVYTGSLDKSVKVWRVSKNAPDSSMFQSMVSPGHGGSPYHSSSPSEFESYSSPPGKIRFNSSTTAMSPYSPEKTNFSNDGSNGNHNNRGSTQSNGNGNGNNNRNDSNNSNSDSTKSNFDDGSHNCKNDGAYTNGNKNSKNHTAKSIANDAKSIVAHSNNYKNDTSKKCGNGNNYGNDDSCKRDENLSNNDSVYANDIKIRNNDGSKISFKCSKYNSNDTSNNNCNNTRAKANCNSNYSHKNDGATSNVNGNDKSNNNEGGKRNVNSNYSHNSGGATNNVKGNALSNNNRNNESVKNNGNSNYSQANNGAKSNGNEKSNSEGSKSNVSSNYSQRGGAKSNVSENVKRNVNSNVTKSTASADSSNISQSNANGGENYTNNPFQNNSYTASDHQNRNERQLQSKNQYCN